MREGETYFLSSFDSRRFSEFVRTCRVVRRVVLSAHEQTAFVVRLDPPIVGQDFDRGEDIVEFVVSPRFVGDDLGIDGEFPLFVRVWLPSTMWDPLATVVSPGDADLIDWAELYRSANDAKEHRFDRREPID